MFEKILGKILVQYFGRFISGIDKNNLKLSVWSGNVVIENVNLKPELIEMLELPVKLKHSQVGKMTIKIPWKKLSSQPLEITIENVYLTLNPLPQSEWQFGDEIIVQKKFQAINEYCKKCLKRGLKKKKSKPEEEKDKGYLDKLAIKVMDNIQLSIVNIHMRYEGPYSFGVTLESLVVATTDENWNATFVDRTESKNPSLVMNKLLSLKNLALYWNTEPLVSSQDYSQFMEARILRNDQQARQLCQFIITVSAELQLVQNAPQLYDKPLKDMVLNLEVLNLLVQHRQFQQMVHLFDLFSKYSKLLWVQRKKALNMDREKVIEHQRNFAPLYSKIQLSDKKTIEVLDENEQFLFKQAIRFVDYSILLDWVQITARQLIKEAKLNYATNSKIKKETAWWKGSDKKQAQDVFLNEEEIMAINQQIDKIFEEERKKVETRPEESLDYRFAFMLRGGVIRVNKEGEGLQLVFSDLCTTIESQQNNSFDLLFKLQSLNLDLLNQGEEIQKFFYKSPNSQLIDQFLKIHFKKNALSKEEDASVIVQLEPLDCMYDSLFVRRWQEFFFVEDVLDNVVQDAAKDKLKATTENNFDQLMSTDLRLKLEVSVASPTIYMQQWLFNMGNLVISSEEDSKLYHNYSLKLSDLSLKAGNVHVLKQLQVELSVEKLKSKIPNKTLMIVSGMVPPIELILNDQLQRDILELDKLIFPQRTEHEKLQKLVKQKQLIIANQTYHGFVQKKDGNLWQKQYAILSGQSIYFFRKEHDIKWEDKLQLSDMELIQSQDSILLQSESRTVSMQCDEKLLDELGKLMDMFKNDNETAAQAVDLVEKSYLQLQLKLSKFKVQLFGERHMLYDLTIDDILYKSHKKTSQMEFSVIVGDLQIRDYVHKFEDESFQYLIRRDDQSQDAILEYKCRIDQTHALTQVCLGSILLNWKPDTYLRITQFAKVGTEIFGIETQQVQDDEALQILQGDTESSIKQSKIESLFQEHKNRNYGSELRKFKNELLNLQAIQANLGKVAHLFVQTNLKVVQTLEVKVEKGRINLLHRQSHVYLGQVYLENLLHRVEFTQMGKFMTGDIAVVHLFDTTNYPSTLEAPSSVQILAADHGVKYYYTFYNRDYMKDQLDIIDAFSQIHITDACLVYQNQQLMRYINYIFVQIIQLIANPQMVTLNDGNIEKPRLVCGTIESLFNSFMSPQMMYQEYVVDRAHIHLKKDYNDPHFLKLEAKNAVYNNNQTTDPSRIIFSQYDIPAWVDRAALKIEEAQIYLDQHLLTNKVAYSFEWHRLIFEDEIKEIIPAQLKNNFEFYSGMNEIDAQISQDELNTLVRILSYNFIFDDGKDSLFIHNYALKKSQQQTEIRFMIHFPKIQATLQKMGKGFMVLELGDVQIETFLASNDDKTTNIYSKTCRVHQMTHKLDIEEISPVIGPFRSRELFQKIEEQSEIKSQLQFIQPFHYLTRSPLRKGQRPTYEGFEFILDLIITQKSKELIIDFDKNPIHAEIQLFLDFLKLIDLEESCFPPSKEAPKKFVTVVNIKHALIVFPSLQDPIVARGFVNYIFEKNKFAVSQKVTVQQIEFFICSMDDLLSLPFNDAEKRHIIMPTNIYYRFQESPDPHQTIISQHDISMERIMLQLCYQDLESFIGVFRYQQRQFLPAMQQLESQKKIVQHLFNLQLSWLQIILISVDQSPVPIFEISLKDTEVSFTKIQQYILNIQQQFQVSYFNVNLGTWEPFIEPILVLMDHSFNQSGNPKQFTNIQINEADSNIPLNINVTIAAMKAFYEIQDKWSMAIKNIEKKEIAEQMKQRHSIRKSFIQSAIQNEKIQGVSPYILNNQTGYDLELTVINRTKKSTYSVKVKKDEQFGMKYQENYFSQNLERRQISALCTDSRFQFKEITQLNFQGNKDMLKPIEYKIGVLAKQTNVLVRFVSSELCKVMTLSSDIAFENKTDRTLEIQITNRIAEISKNLEILPNSVVYLPLGFEQAVFRCRYKDVEQWTSYLDLVRFLQGPNCPVIDIFEQPPYLCLLVQKSPNPIVPKRFLFQPPYALKNFLPCQLEIHLQLGNPLSLASGQSLKVQNSPRNRGFRFNLKLPAFHPSSPIDITPQLSTPMQFILRDYQGIELWLQLIPIGQAEGIHTFLIDGGMTILNSLGNHIYFYGRKRNKSEKERDRSYQSRSSLHPDMEYLAGQPIFSITEKEDQLRSNGNLQIVNEVDYLQFSFEQGCVGMKQGQFSQQFATFNAIGQYLINVPKEEGHMEVLIDIQRVVQELGRDEKIITLSPRYVILNRLNQNLTVQQHKCPKTLFLLPDVVFPFYWFNSQADQFIKLKIKDLHSGCLSLDMQGTLTLPMRDEANNLTDHLSITAKEEDKIKYILVEPLQKGQKPLYRIKNKLNFDISFYQTETTELNDNMKTKVNIGSQVDYSFDNPGFKKLLTLEFFKDGVFCDFVKIQLQTAEKSTKQTMVDDSSFYISSRFSLEDRQIEVVLSEQQEVDKKREYDSLENQLEVQIPKINFSFIIPNPRRELVNICLNGIHFLVINDEISETVQLKIKDMQIDNNEKTRCTYPVLLTQKIADPNIPVLSMVLKRAHKIDFINYFQTMLFSIRPLVVKLTEGTFDELQLFLEELKVFDKTGEVRKHNSWQNGIKKSQQLCFFELIQLYPLQILISFQTIEKKTAQYLKQAATQAINCDEVPITLKGFSLSNCFTTKDQLTNKIMMNYKDALKANLYQLIGSIDILGNPVGLIRDLGGGFQDLFEMPYDGFVKGPLEGGIGLAKGVGSLTKGIVSGTFNTVSKVTGSVASGISQLSFDDEYLRDRQIQNSKKAKTVVHGLGQGMVSLFQGVGLGIAGLVTQPFQGAEKEGVEGFFKGMSKGIVGLVVKPVVGAIDLASKTAEGVKNTANYFDDKPNEIRMRLPRVFYGEEGQFRNYLLQDSEIFYILDKLIPNLCMLDTFVYQIGKYKFAYVFTQRFFLVLEILKKKIVLQIKNEEIKGYELMKSEFRIYLHSTKTVQCEKDRLQKGLIEVKRDMISIRQDQGIHDYLERKLGMIFSIVHDA